MKSTTYDSRAGAAQRPPADLEGPDVVEEIIVERPYTFELNERLMGIIQSRIVGANAKWVYLYYLVVGHYDKEKVSLRATARTLNMPRETFRRARKELEEAHIVIPVRAGVLGHNRLLVRDIRDVKPDPTQNESPPTQNGATQNESPRISHAMRDGPLLRSKKSSENLEAYNEPSISLRILRNNERQSRVGLKTEIGDDVFADPPPTATLFAMLEGVWPPEPRHYPKTSAKAPGANFKLKPPPGAKGARSPSRTRRHDIIIPGWVYPKVYEICFGVTTSQQQSALGRAVAGRVGRAITSLAELNADFNRLGEFLTWFKSWATGRPKPETVVSQWLNFVEQTEEKQRANQSTEYAEQLTQQNERWTDDSMREFARRRARELGNPNA